MGPRSYPKPQPFTWPQITPRPLLPVFPPPDPLSPPALPSPPRKPAFDAPYTLTTHLFPAAHLRTTRHVPVPQHPPKSVDKAERRRIVDKTRQELKDLRTSFDPQGSPQILWNCANRYVRNDLNGKRGKGVTLFFAHANGFPKEIWEPTLHYLLTSPACSVIDEVWTWESVQHGDSALLNASTLGGIFDWTDAARDILNFLIYYLPSTVSATPLPPHLLRLPPEESEHRKTDGFRDRTFLAIGHSFGGCICTLAALTSPALFSSIILIDPVIVKPRQQSIDNLPDNPESVQLIFGALLRRETWNSREQALEIFKKSPFFGAWDPEVLKVYVECGTYPSHDEDGNTVVRLKMPGIQEAVVFSEMHTRNEVFQRFPGLDEKIEVRWIMPGKPGADEFGPQGSAQQRVWARANNVSNIRIPNAGHLIPQEAPQDLAREMQEFIQRRYLMPKSSL